MMWNGGMTLKRLMSGFESRRSFTTFSIIFHSIFQNNSYLCIGVGTSVDVGNPSGVGIVNAPEFAQHGQPTCSMQV